MIKTFHKNVIPQRDKGFIKPKNQITINERTAEIILTTNTLIEKRKIFLTVNNSLCKSDSIVCVPTDRILLNTGYLIRAIKVFEGGFIIGIMNIYQKKNSDIVFTFGFWT